MFTLNQLRQELSRRFNEELDIEILEKNLHVWDLEPDSTNQDNKVFDKSTLASIYTAFKLKKEGYTDALVSRFIKKSTKESNNTVLELEKNLQKDYSHLFEEQDSNIKTNKVTNIAEKQLEKSAIHYKDKNDLSLENHKIVDEIEEKELKENQSIKDTNKSLLVKTLSDNISEKVSSQILSYLNSEDYLEPIKKSSMLQRDNEILSKQVEELIKANTELEEKVFKLELKNNCFKKIWGDLFIYLK